VDETGSTDTVRCSSVAARPPAPTLAGLTGKTAKAFIAEGRRQ
jgi:hypothetical protein